MEAHRGFTLVELLIVIAIIGVLASIVLSSLSSSRTQATEAQTKGTVNQAGLQIELYYTTNGNYGPTFSWDACPTSGSTIFYSDVRLRGLLADIKSKNGHDYVSCATGGPSASAATSWAIASPLKSGTLIDGPFWCIDSSGSRKTWIAARGNSDPLPLAFIKTFIPVAYAGVVPLYGPYLGGGTGTTAQCE